MTCVSASKVLVIIIFVISVLNLTGTEAIRCYTNLEEVFLFVFFLCVVALRIWNLLQSIHYLPTI